VGTHQINTLWVSQQNKQKTTTIAFWPKKKGMA
jgi:hypothetical protein